MELSWILAAVIVMASIYSVSDYLMGSATFTFWGRSRIKVRILYKSGNSHECWMIYFMLKDNKYSWETYGSNIRPIDIGVGEIEAIWRIEAKLSIWRILPWVINY